MDAGEATPPDRGAGRASEGDRAVRVLRGRASTPMADREATAALLDRAAETGHPGVRAWVPHRQVAFGRRDVRASGYDRARRAATRRGYAAVDRRVGGRAVAYTGRTVAFVHALPIDDPRRGIEARYDAAVGAIRDALRSLGAAVECGEPPDAFCPGAHSVRARDGGKVAGVAQRIRSDAALVGGCVPVDDRAAQRAVLAPVYDALGVPLDPDAVGSVAAAGGPADSDRVALALEAALVAGRPTRVEHVTAERTS